VLDLADHGLVDAVRRNAPLARGVNVWHGEVVHPAVADSLDVTATPLEKLLDA
jgi:alanine dehydrogenase